MQIVECKTGDVTILRLTGRLVYEDGFDDLRQALNRVLGEGGANVLLNLDEVTYLDSAGVGLIACKYVTLSRLGGQLKLCNLHSRSHRVLNITKLLTIFESFDSEADGVKSFGANSGLAG
jgi:anti-sigma B factor antagonist